MVSQTPDKIDNRYLIRSQVGKGGMGVVYSAYDRLTGDVVALKNVKSDSQPQIEETTASIADFRVALAQEFSVLATLRHPNIISVLDFGFDFEQQPYFTMTLLKQSQTIVDYARGLSVARKIELIIQMIEAIDYLHRRGIIHRDLKPENVIINDGQVKVLDFGVARLQNQTVNEPKDIVVGTLAFMAPEILQEEHDDSLARLSDVYAAGLIAYEVLTDIFPYDTSNISKLIQQIVTHIPDAKPLDMLETDLDRNDLSLTVLRMLEKNPLDRYPSTDQVLDAFYTILCQPRQTDIEVRESILQTAKMVGRDAELNQLDESLKMVFTEQGGVWLIGGEAGVGKSRLVDELRIRALVRGALVVRGQAITEASSPYQVWRSVLRRILLEVTVEPLEMSVLKPLVDDIEKLLQVDQVPAAPEIGAVASYNRLLTVISQILTRLNRELLIILEDLHWSRESLFLLRQIIPLTHNNPIMIVGTYRTDERPELTDLLPGAQIMQLERLNNSAISAYAESVAGKTSALPEIVTLLQQETTGNVMFIIEFLRAIIENIGSLDYFERDTVPSEMLGGGVQQVIRYRLRDIPPTYHELLEMAAILGRVINLEVMNHLFEPQQVNEWLQYGEEMMLLRIRNDQWRISNDTVRKTILEDIAPDHLIHLHTRAAEAISTLYGDEAGAVRLAYHWESAGDLAREAKYKTIVAHQSFESSAFSEAAENLERLLDLHQESQLILDPLTVARYRRMLGTCYIELGMISESMTVLKAAVSELRASVPSNSMFQGVALFGQVIRQVWHRFTPFDLVERDAQQHARITEAALAMNQIAEVALAYQPEQFLSIYASLRVLNMSELIGPGYSLTYSYAGVALLVASIGRHGWAQTYLNLAHDIMATHELSKTTLAVSSFPMAIVYVGWGQWEQAQELVDQSLTISDEIGDWKSWRQAIGLAGDMAHFRADYHTAIARYIDAYTSTERVRNLSQMAIQLAIRSRSLFMIGRYSEALTVAEEALRLDDAPMVTLNAIPVQVLNAVRLSAWDAAQARLDHLNEKITANPFKIFVHLDGYATAAEASLALMTQRPNDQNRQQAQSACKAMFDYAKVFPIGQARAQLFEARRLAFDGDTAKAQELANDALATATRLNMGYEIGLAQMVLGRVRDDEALITKARARFERIHSAWGLHQLDYLTI
ncbi:MAG: serine/threonine-protein kinase PknK [Anaerolineae bacterium]